MRFQPHEYIRSRSRKSWLKLLNEKWIDLRIFVQENGELSFLIGFGLGLLVVFFFRLFMGLFVVALLLAALVWNLAAVEEDAVEDEIEADLNIPGEKSIKSENDLLQPESSSAQSINGHGNTDI